MKVPTIPFRHLEFLGSEEDTTQIKRKKVQESPSKYFQLILFISAIFKSNLLRKMVVYNSITELMEII